jgi:hypothetical protein
MVTWGAQRNATEGRIHVLASWRRCALRQAVVFPASRVAAPA